MSDLATFETILLVISIGMQGWFFWQTWQRMRKFSDWIPSEELIKIIPKRIPLLELTQTSTDQLLERFYQGKLRFAEGIKLPMLQADNYNSAARYQLFYALNRYLLKS